MVDNNLNINFSGRINNETQYQQNNKTVQSVKIKPDEFIRSTKMEEQKNFSQNDILKIFSRYSYDNIANKIIENNNCFLAECSIDLIATKNDNPCVLVQIYDDYDGTTEVYNYSKQEIFELLAKLNKNAISESPEKAEEYTALHAKLIEKIEAEFE